MKCFEMRTQVKESAEGRGNTQMQEVAAELRGEVRVWSVNMMEGGRVREAVWFSKAQWQEAFYPPREKQKETD